MSDGADGTLTSGAFPSDLPARIDGTSAWVGPAMAARSDWIETLAADELDELATAGQAWIDGHADLTRAAHS